MALWDSLETPWGPLVPSMAIPCGLLVPFGATGRPFGGQMGSSWAKPGAKCDPNLSQNVSHYVTKSKAEFRSIFLGDLGTYVGPNDNFGVLFGLWDVLFAHRLEPLLLHTLATLLKVFLVWRCRAVVQIHQQINDFAKLGFRYDFMVIWGFMLEHFGHILGFNSASKSIPELEIHHGGPMGASERPLVTSDGHMGTPRRKST